MAFGPDFSAEFRRSVSTRHARRLEEGTVALGQLRGFKGTLARIELKLSSGQNLSPEEATRLVVQSRILETYLNEYVRSSQGQVGISVLGYESQLGNPRNQLWHR